MQPLPWLSLVTEKFSRLIADNQCPQAILFEGVKGLGLDQLSLSLAQQILRTDNAQHPDIKWLEKAESSHQIKIDEVRTFCKFLSLKPFSSSCKVGMIKDAHLMNINAQNALLKTLEEPSQSSIIILISNERGRLLPTLYSRCQMWRIVPNEIQIDTFLSARFPGEDLHMLKKVCHLGPLNLPDLNGMHDFIQKLVATTCPLAIAESQKSHDINDVLNIVFLYVLDLKSIALGHEALTFKPYETQMQKVAMSLTSLQNVLLKLKEAQQSILMGVNLNAQLMLEDILISLQRDRL